MQARIDERKILLMKPVGTCMIQITEKLRQFHFGLRFGRKCMLELKQVTYRLIPPARKLWTCIKFRNWSRAQHVGANNPMNAMLCALPQLRVHMFDTLFV